MGAGNVKLAFVHWGDLPGSAFRLLTYMALRTKDNDPSPQFWAGREDLAFALGRVVPPVTDEESKRIREAHFKAVKVALGVLSKRGAVSTKERARPGSNAVYTLHLARGRWTKTVPHMVDENRTPVGDENPPEWGTVFVGTGAENRPPEEEKDEYRTSRGTDSEGDQQPAGVAHARTRGAKRESYIAEFDYQAASAFLLTLPDDHQDRELEVARRVWVRLSEGRAGTLRRTGWRFYVNPSGSSSSMPAYLAGYVGRMAATAERLARVSLEARPALELIEAYGKEPDVLLYVDPPYLGSTRSRNYRHEMSSDAEHLELADALNAARAAVVLSGYNSPLYLEAYDGWHRHEITTMTGQANEWQSRTEVLWSNRPFPVADHLFTEEVTR